MGRILGIDYGSRKVGVAMSDDVNRFAFAKEVLPNDDALLDTLSQLAERYGVEYFVVGESDNPAGGKNVIMHRIIIFSKALETRTGLRVVQVNEAFSTAEARRPYDTKIKTRKTKERIVDDSAAAIILQNHLDAIAGEKTLHT